MTTIHRSYLAGCIAVMLVLVACVPPPVQPPYLGGNPHHTGMQRLTVAIIDSAGNVDECSLTLNSEIDLGYSTIQVSSKTSAQGDCPSNAWIETAAFIECNHDGAPTTDDCGGPYFINSTGTFTTPRVFYQVGPMHLAWLRVTFKSVLVTPTGLRFPVRTVGFSPVIHCSNELQQCKFQG